MRTTDRIVPARRTRRAAVAATLLTLTLATAGCSAGADPGAASGTGAGRTGATGGTGESGPPGRAGRETIAAGLARAGHTHEARLVRRKDVRVTPLAAPYLAGGRILRVDAQVTPHPVRYHVGVSGTQVFLLTADPGAFGRLAAAAGARVGGADDAAALARTYLEATRDTGRLGYVVGNVREIVFRPGLTGPGAARRDQIVARYRTAVAPPRATPAPGGFRAVAYTVRDRELRRHTLTVTAGGAVRDQVQVLAADLPVPYTV